jgi:hypothetical protein
MGVGKNGSEGNSTHIQEGELALSDVVFLTDENVGGLGLGHEFFESGSAVCRFESQNEGIEHGLVNVDAHRTGVDQRIAFVSHNECGVVGADCHGRGTQNLEVTIFIVEKSGARCSDHDELPRERSYVGVKERLEVSHIVGSGGRNGSVATNSFSLLVV